MSRAAGWNGSGDLSGCLPYTSLRWGVEHVQPRRHPEAGPEHAGRVTFPSSRGVLPKELEEIAGGGEGLGPELRKAEGRRFTVVLDTFLTFWCERQLDNL